VRLTQESPTFLLPIEKEIQKLDKKNFACVNVLFGDEHYFVNEFIRSVMRNGVEDSSKSFNLDVLQGNDVALDTILACARQLPMAGMFDVATAQRRVVIVRNFELGRKKENEEKLFFYFQKPANETVLVLDMPKLDMKMELYKKLSAEKYVSVVHCKALSDEQAIALLAREFAHRKKNISKEHCERIRSTTGNSVSELLGTVEKIVTFLGERDSISVNELREIVSNSNTYDVWDLQNAVHERNLSRALEIAQRLLETGESSVGMLAMLSNFFMRQLQPKHRLNYGKTTKYANAEIRKNLSLLVAADSKRKSSSLDDYALMTQLLLEIVPKAFVRK